LLPVSADQPRQPVAISSPVDSTIPPVDTAPTRIRNIICKGNKVTKPDIILLFVKIDPGTVYDTAKIREAKERLEATGLFMKVTMLPVRKEGAVDLYVIVKEPVYIGLPSLDFTPFTHRYGVRGDWYCPLFGLEFTNVRGRMENIRISARAWEWRMLSVGWQKPLLPSRYFIGVSGAADRLPDYRNPFDRIDYAASFTVGRKLFSRSQAYCTLIPLYQEIRDTSTPAEVSRFRQTFGAVGWYTDRRSSPYDPSRGWTLLLDARTNHLYHDADADPFFQISAETRYFHPAIRENDKIALKMAVVARTNDAGIQNRLMLGGLYSLRGYGSGGLDLTSGGSASALACCEYRFPLYQLPPLANIIPAAVANLAYTFGFDCSDLAPRIDGALICDWGRVARNLGSLAATGGRDYISGTELGFGLRLLAPTLRLGGSFDLVWIEKPYTRGVDFYGTPMPMLYVNLAF
jgi:hypothetical protein